ncbi:MAG: DUF2877 domain-containing protein, partial [Anaerolineae bacterium]
MPPLKTTQSGINWLTRSDSFRILHHFDYVCNLINQSNQILALHTAEVGLGPFSCQIDPTHFQQIRSAESIKLAPLKNGFSINNHFFSIKTCKLWNARPDWESFACSSIAETQHQLTDDVETMMRTLHQAICAKNNQAIHDTASRLAGRGIGLTPEGDDVLLGTIYALHVLGLDKAIIEMIGEATIGRTTSLSAAFLQAAVAGEATEHWHDVLEGKAGALDKLLAVGATSGKDAWHGFTAG